MTDAPLPELRATLFGDLPIDAWPAGDDASDAPWDGFVRARAHLAAGDQDLAVREWAAIAATPGLESRHALQAWHFLRSVNVHPDASIAAEVLGVVAEVAVDGGHDVLAAYRDGSVRYLNHAGGATIVDAAPPEVGEAVAALLLAAQPLADTIGVWTEPSLPELPTGHHRLLLLTRSGHRFGQAPGDALWSDPSAGPVLATATQVLTLVIGR